MLIPAWHPWNLLFSFEWSSDWLHSLYWSWKIPLQMGHCKVFFPVDFTSFKLKKNANSVLLFFLFLLWKGYSWWMELQITTHKLLALLGDKSYFLLSFGFSICQTWAIPKHWVSEVLEELNRYSIYTFVLFKNARHSRGKRFLFLLIYAKFTDVDDTTLSLFLH